MIETEGRWSNSLYFIKCQKKYCTHEKSIIALTSVSDQPPVLQGKGLGGSDVKLGDSAMPSLTYAYGL